MQFAPDGETVGFHTFREAFQATVTESCDFACLPVENSLAGSINQTYDLLTDSVLHVVGEQIVRVHHNLLAKPGTKLEEVKRVYSHPQALAQCQAFLAKHHMEAVTDFDTAGAAKLLADGNNSGGGEGKAAIASKRAAEIYGLEILREHIEDVDFNYTRFFILGPDEKPKGEGKHKSSLVIATRHRPGDLVACLEQFPEYGINMTKLESRPPPRQALELPLLYRHRRAFRRHECTKRNDRADEKSGVRQVLGLVSGCALHRGAVSGTWLAREVQARG